MAQKIGANELAESVMAFNTNYSDAGLFGVYAVAKVWFLTGIWLTLFALIIGMKTLASWNANRYKIQKNRSFLL